MYLPICISLLFLGRQYEQTSWNQEQVRIRTRTRFERCMRLYGHHLLAGVFS